MSPLPKAAGLYIFGTTMNKLWISAQFNFPWIAAWLCNLLIVCLACTSCYFQPALVITFLVQTKHCWTNLFCWHQHCSIQLWHFVSFLIFAILFSVSSTIFLWGLATAQKVLVCMRRWDSQTFLTCKVVFNPDVILGADDATSDC